MFLVNISVLGQYKKKHIQDNGRDFFSGLLNLINKIYTSIFIKKREFNSVVRAFGGPIELFLVPANVPWLV